MRKYYILRLFIFFLLTVFGVTACVEKEDMVMPQETCETMAVVQYKDGCGVQLVLENGQILLPANAKINPAKTAVKEFSINGFSVTEGQQIIIGYSLTADQAVSCNATSGKNIKVNCIVGFKEHATS